MIDFTLPPYVQRRGDEWIINGTKAPITNAQYADVILLCAMTAPGCHGGGGTDEIQPVNIAKALGL